MRVISSISNITYKMLLKQKELEMGVKKKLLDIVRDKTRLKHHSYSPERTYVHWIKQLFYLRNTKSILLSFRYQKISHTL